MATKAEQQEQAAAAELEAQVQTAEASSSVTNSTSTTTTPKGKAKTNARGVHLQQWDNPANDPNKRKHVGLDPDGEHNAKLLEKK